MHTVGMPGDARAVLIAVVHVCAVQEHKGASLHLSMQHQHLSADLGILRGQGLAVTVQRNCVGCGCASACQI